MATRCGVFRSIFPTNLPPCSGTWICGDLFLERNHSGKTVEKRYRVVLISLLLAKMFDIQP